jgi:PAS domain S-box-containing protein
MTNDGRPERPATPRERELMRQLQAERSRLHRILQQTPAFIAIARGPEHVFEMANPAYHQLVGHREILGRPLREAIPEVEEQGLLALLDEVYRTGRPFHCDELPILLQNEPGGALEQRFLDLVYQPLQEADGSVSGIMAHGVDITERVLTRNRVAAAEAHYRRLVHSSPLATFVVDVTGRLAETNPAGSALLGYPSEALRGRPLRRFVHPADWSTVAAMGRHLTSNGAGAVDGELRIRRGTGETRLLRATGVAIRDAGTIVGVQVAALDVTAERESAERMRLLTTVLESLEAGVCIFEAPGLRLHFANAAWARLLGCVPGETEAFTLEEFLPDQAARDQMLEIQRALETTSRWSGRIWRRRRDDGRTTPFDAVIGRVTGAGGQTLVFAIMQPAAEAIEAERHLHRAERLASVGTLISGVAHELNNPLHAIRGLSDLLLRTEASPERREDLGVVVEAADRMAKTIADLRLVVRQAQEEIGERGRVDLNAVIGDVLESQEYSLSTRNVEVLQELDADLPSVWGTEGELRLVVQNLLVNAVQALTEPDRARRVAFRTTTSDGTVSLHVSDSGVGIPPEYQERIFDPFWTTRQPGEGAGLGLSLVHRIVTEHGGEIEVDSQPGMGATFRLRLPRAPSEAARPSEPAERTAPPASLRVLVVDDEAASRRVIARLLTRRGHHGDEASDGEAALRMLQGTEYDVIISDLRMPGLGGEVLLQRLRERGGGREPRLVFVTGDVSDSRSVRTLEAAGLPVLLKPVGVEALARAIESTGHANDCHHV